MTNAINSELTWPYFKFLFDSKLSTDNMNVKYMRSIATTGFPLIINGVKYKNNNDDPDNLQDEYFEEFIYKLEDDLQEEFAEFFP